MRRKMMDFVLQVHLQHEERPSRLHSHLEMNYGKHWDEINNKKKLLISQTFKNSSSHSLASYFMEVIASAGEKYWHFRKVKGKLKEKWGAKHKVQLCTKK